MKTKKLKERIESLLAGDQELEVFTHTVRRNFDEASRTYKVRYVSFPTLVIALWILCHIILPRVLKYDMVISFCRSGGHTFKTIFRTFPYNL